MTSAEKLAEVIARTLAALRGHVDLLAGAEDEAEAFLVGLDRMTADAGVVPLLSRLAGLARRLPYRAEALEDTPRARVLARWESYAMRPRDHFALRQAAGR
jgi:hypothetical protein